MNFKLHGLPCVFMLSLDSSQVGGLHFYFFLSLFSLTFSQCYNTWTRQNSPLPLILIIFPTGAFFIGQEKRFSSLHPFKSKNECCNSYNISSERNVSLSGFQIISAMDQPSKLPLSPHLAAFEASPCGLDVKYVMSPHVWWGVILLSFSRSKWED